MGRLQDLTLMYITASEVPDCWLKFQLHHLLKSAKNFPIISVSRKPLSLGTNIIDNGEKSYWNIYMQMLRAARLANTPYVAMVEDDTLYTPEHFTEFRPALDATSFDRSRWSLFAWESNPIFCLRQRVSNCSTIASRELLIEALEERRQKWPNGAPNEKVGEVGRSKIEHKLGVTVRKSVEWYCSNPIVQLNHLTGTDVGDYGRVNGKHLVKKHGQIKAIEIPYWGRASDIVRIYNGK